MRLTSPPKYPKRLLLFSSDKVLEALGKCYLYAKNSLQSPNYSPSHCPLTVKEMVVHSGAGAGGRYTHRSQLKTLLMFQHWKTKACRVDGANCACVAQHLPPALQTQPGHAQVTSIKSSPPGLLPASLTSQIPSCMVVIIPAGSLELHAVPS